MRPASVGLIAAGVVIAAVAALVPARSQVNVTTYVPIGVASSGTTSTAWFHESSSRRVLVCQYAANGSSIACVSGNLP